MKKTLFAVFSLALILALAGCGGGGEETTGNEATPAPAQGSTAITTLSDDYPDALSIRSQLMLGTLKLEETGNAVTPEQTEELLPLWQASRSLTRTGTGAEEEVDAVLAQIQEAMTSAQIEAIAAMQLTRADNQTLAQEMGLTTGTGESEGGGQRGQGQNLSPEERATRQAEKAERSTTGASEALLDELIKLLEERAE